MTKENKKLAGDKKFRHAQVHLEKHTRGLPLRRTTGCSGQGERSQPARETIYAVAAMIGALIDSTALSGLKTSRAKGGAGCRIPN